MSVARIILNQMGGQRRLKMMIGARNFVDHGKGLSFKFPRPSRGKPNYVKITLGSDDLYKMEFGSVHGTNFRILKTEKAVYNNMLMDLFEKETGLYLTLGRRRANSAVYYMDALEGEVFSIPEDVDQETLDELSKLDSDIQQYFDRNGDKFVLSKNDLPTELDWESPTDRIAIFASWETAEKYATDRVRRELQKEGSSSIWFNAQEILEEGYYFDNDATDSWISDEVYDNLGNPEDNIKANQDKYDELEDKKTALSQQSAEMVAKYWIYDVPQQDLKDLKMRYLDPKYKKMKRPPKPSRTPKKVLSQVESYVGSWNSMTTNELQGAIEHVMFLVDTVIQKETILSYKDRKNLSDQDEVDARVIVSEMMDFFSKIKKDISLKLGLGERVLREHPAPIPSLIEDLEEYQESIEEGEGEYGEISEEYWTNFHKDIIGARGVVRYLLEEHGYSAKDALAVANEIDFHSYADWVVSETGVGQILNSYDGELHEETYFVWVHD